jgi:hypothetical protein
MSTTMEMAQSCVTNAIRDVNEQHAGEVHIPDDPATELLGPASPLDSVTFAYFIVTIEQYALDDYDQEIVLFDEEVMELDFEALDNPFYTVGSLIAFVAGRLTE